MKISKTTRLIVVIALSLTVLIFSAIKLLDVSMWKIGRQFSEYSSSKNYRYIFNRDLPSGVKELKFAGRSYGFKQWFWIRCKADDLAIKELLKNSNLQTTTAINASDYYLPAPSARSNFDVSDKAKVQWQDLNNAKQPEYYRWSTSDPTSWYYGYFIVDRKRHLVFAVGQTE